MTIALHNQRTGKKTSPPVEAPQNKVWTAAGEIGWPMDTWCHSSKGRHPRTDQQKTVNEPTGVSRAAFVSMSHCKPERPEGATWRLQQAVASQSRPDGGSQQSEEGLLPQPACRITPGA